MWSTTQHHRRHNQEQSHNICFWNHKNEITLIASFWQYFRNCGIVSYFHIVLVVLIARKDFHLIVEIFCVHVCHVHWVLPLCTNRLKCHLYSDLNPVMDSQQGVLSIPLVDSNLSKKFMPGFQSHRLWFSHATVKSRQKCGPLRMIRAIWFTEPHYAAKSLPKHNYFSCVLRDVTMYSGQTQGLITCSPRMYWQ